MKFQLAQCLGLLLSVSQAQQTSQLIVNGPQSLVTKFEQRINKQTNTIDAVFANYGHVPYGQSIFGNLYFNTSNPLGCSKDSEFTEFDFDVSNEQIHTAMILVDRGECTFVTKTRNIERAGGQLALVVDNSEHDIQDIIMSDDGTGQGLRIPSMIISMKDGQLLKDFLSTASTDEISKVQLTAQFEMANPDNSVDVKFWYTTNDDKSLQFVKDMGKYIMAADKSERGIDFEPKFVHWSCPFCDSDFKRLNCVSDGKYCGMNHENGNSSVTALTGKEVVLENLRQYCVYKVSESDTSYYRFFNYVTMVHSLCEDRITAACHKKALQSLPYAGFGADAKDRKDVKDKMNGSTAVKEIKACIEDSWENAPGAKADPTTDDNVYLRQMLEDWNNYGHHLYPSVIINDITFRGQLNPFNVFEAICAGYKDLPEQCSQWLEDEGISAPHIEELIAAKSQNGISKATFTKIVSTLILCNLVLIFAYRRNLDKEIKGEMKIQVSSAVSQYVALSQISELQTEGSQI